MIPHQLPLLAWIPISALLMADKNEARGFSIAFLAGLMFLPEGEVVYLPGLPDLEKGNVGIIGTFLGTLIFHPRNIERLRLELHDFLLVGFIQALIIHTIIHDAGMYTAVVRSLNFIVGTVLLILTARMTIATPRGIRTFFFWFVVCSVFYAPLALYEWRMSPQLHVHVYGYFPHQFLQFIRGGMFRPLVFFSHALKLGQFFALASFLAIFPLRNTLIKTFGRPGKWVFLAPLAGLIVSQSWGPYMLFAGLCGGYFIFKRPKFIVILYVIPIVMMLWMVSLFADYRTGWGIVDVVSEYNPERAASLRYRLDANWLYKENIQKQPWFGFGGYGAGRIENVATDSVILIMLLDYGWVGTLLYVGWWLAAMSTTLKVMHLARGTPLANYALTTAMLAAYGIGISVIDNAMDKYTMILLAAFLGTRSWLVSEQRVTELRPALTTARRA